MTLVKLEEKEAAEITNIFAGWKATKRLADLGLTVKTKIKVLRKALIIGPIVIEVRGSKLVLGRTLAQKVLVKRI